MKKKRDRVADFHGNRYNSVSFVSWSWNLPARGQRIVLLNVNHGFQKPWIIQHLITHLQPLLHQTTFASEKNPLQYPPELLSENEIKGERLPVVGYIRLMQDTAIYKHFYVSPFPIWVPDLLLFFATLVK